MKRYVSFFLVATFVLVGTAISLSAQDRPKIGPGKGQMYPDFYLPSLDGTAGKLSSYRGEKVILFQFASW